MSFLIEGKFSAVCEPEGLALSDSTPPTSPASRAPPIEVLFDVETFTKSPLIKGKSLNDEEASGARKLKLQDDRKPSALFLRLLAPVV